jgi:hypothetical protein
MAGHTSSAPWGVGPLAAPNQRLLIWDAAAVFSYQSHAFGLLRAEVSGCEHDLAVLRQSRAGDALQAQTHRVREARRAAHIEAQLRGARNLVHVLPAGAARPDEGHDDLGLVERDPVRNGDHDPPPPLTQRARETLEKREHDLVRACPERLRHGLGFGSRW